MKDVLVLYALFLMVVLQTSCGQNQPNSPKDTIKPETNNTVTPYGPNRMIRNVKQDRNGNILVASYKGVFRYDGKSFTDITSTISSPSFWDVLEDRKGNLWFASRDSGVYYHDGKSPPTGQAGFQHFTTKEGVSNNDLTTIMEDKTGKLWFGTRGEGAECTVMTERPLLTLKIKRFSNKMNC